MKGLGLRVGVVNGFARYSLQTSYDSGLRLKGLGFTV